MGCWLLTRYLDYNSESRHRMCSVLLAWLQMDTSCCSYYLFRPFSCIQKRLALQLQPPWWMLEPYRIPSTDLSKWRSATLPLAASNFLHLISFTTCLSSIFCLYFLCSCSFWSLIIFWWLQLYSEYFIHLLFKVKLKKFTKECLPAQLNFGVLAPG